MTVFIPEPKLRWKDIVIKANEQGIAVILYRSDMKEIKSLFGIGTAEKNSTYQFKILGYFSKKEAIEFLTKNQRKEDQNE